MIVEENLKYHNSSDVTSKDSDEDQMVEYQGILKYVYMILYSVINFGTIVTYL